MSPNKRIPTFRRDKPKPVQDRALKGSILYDPMTFIGADYFEYLDRKDRGGSSSGASNALRKEGSFSGATGCRQ